MLKLALDGLQMLKITNLQVLRLFKHALQLKIFLSKIIGAQFFNLQIKKIFLFIKYFILCN